jgi:hypothetical protein
MPEDTSSPVASPEDVSPQAVQEPFEPAAEDAEPMSFRRKTARVLACLVAVLIIGLWSYALWGPTKKTAPGVMSDPTFARAAQLICTDAAAVIGALPPAYSSPDAGARAEVILESNAALTTMLARLAAIAPSADAGKDATMVQEWLGDWQTFMGDRERFVVALETDPQARFFVTMKDRRQVTEPIDFFARYNDMSNCETPGDLA